MREIKRVFCVYKDSVLADLGSARCTIVEPWLRCCLSGKSNRHLTCWLSGFLGYGDCAGGSSYFDVGHVIESD